MKPRIYILSGDIQTGKSAALNNWAIQKTNAGAKLGGIINPSIDGIKTFINASTFHSFEMNAKDSESGIIQVGRFRFSKDAFIKAREILTNDLSKPLDYLIIDEIGKLELSNSGLEPVVSQIIDSKDSNMNTRSIICVVRASLLEDVLDKYDLKDILVIDKTKLNEL